jgi:YggT family protein
MSFIIMFISILARALNVAILARVFMSWLPINPESRFVRIILEVTEPIVGPIRRIVPSLGGLDLSPMVALVLIQVLERMLLSMLGGMV